MLKDESSVRFAGAATIRDMSKVSKKISAAPSWLGVTQDRSSFVFLPDRAETVRKIFQLAIGGMGSYAIANYLDELKVPTFTRALNWENTTIDSMLRNRATYGEHQPKSFAAGHKKGIPSGPPISDYYPAVIDKATFDAAQAARQQNLTHRGRKGNDLANIFGDLCSCCYCGGKVIFHRISNVQVLVCEQVLNDGACSRSAWTYKDFEITVLAFLAHPAMLDQASYDLKAGLLDLVEEIKALSSDQERRYARRVNITVLLKRIVAGLLIHSAGNLRLPRHSSAQIRKDIAGRFVEVQLQGGPSYPCISIG